jgi:membrane protease subunit (stomatin/prohibitin family)
MSATTEDQWAEDQLTALSNLSDPVLEALSTQFSTISGKYHSLSEYYKTLENSWSEAGLVVSLVKSSNHFSDDEAKILGNSENAVILLNGLPSNVQKVFARGLDEVSRVSGDTASEDERAGLSEALERFELE